MDLMERIIALMSQVNMLISENSQLKQNEENLKKENDNLENKVVSLENEKGALEDEVNVLTDKNNMLEDEVNVLTDKNNMLEDENNELKQEKEGIENAIEQLEELMNFLNPPIQSGGMGYNTIQDAINYSPNGSVVKLNKNMNINETIIVDKEITLDLNGKSISNEENIFCNTEDKKNWSLISVRNGGKLTVVGNGVVEAKENDCYAIDLYGGNCVIENGKFIGNVTTIYAHTGYLTIKDGDFSLKQLSDIVAEDRHRYMLNCLDVNYRNGVSNITVEGGRFENFNPQNNLAEGKGTNFIAEGHIVIEDGNSYIVI